MNYELIVNSIHDKKSCLTKTSYILSDTIEQVTNLKLELQLQYKYDVNKYPNLQNLLNELQEMEDDLKEESDNINKLLNEMDDLKQKQKVKKI